jgi:hypothetical protein
MAISVDWGTSIITVPKADTTLVSAGPPEIREYDVNTLRVELKDAEDSFEGIPYSRTHNHNTTVVVSGITLARVFEIIAPYTVTFEDGQYTVNLFGANHNVIDVANANQVRLTARNSGGLLEGAGADAVWNESRTELASIPGASPTAHEMLRLIYMWIRNEVTQDGTNTRLKNNAGSVIGTGTDSESGGLVTKGKLS